jgi:phage terminase large subunit-like protein
VAGEGDAPEAPLAGPPREALWKGDFDKAYNDRERKLRFADGSWMDFLTHEMDVDAFAGADMHFVWFDEEPSGEKGKAQFEESLARLVDYDGHMRWTLTPLLGLNFVYYELTEQGRPAEG